MKKKDNMRKCPECNGKLWWFNESTLEIDICEMCNGIGYVRKSVYDDLSIEDRIMIEKDNE